MLGVQIFTWVTTILCLVGTALNVKKINWCFYIWTMTNLAWGIYDIVTGLYSRAVLDFVQLGFALWGIIAWRNSKRK